MSSTENTLESNLFVDENGRWIDPVYTPLHGKSGWSPESFVANEKALGTLVDGSDAHYAELMVGPEKAGKFLKLPRGLRLQSRDESTSIAREGRYFFVRNNAAEMAEFAQGSKADRLLGLGVQLTLEDRIYAPKREKNPEFNALASTINRSGRVYRAVQEDPMRFIEDRTKKLGPFAKAFYRTFAVPVAGEFAAVEQVRIANEIQGYGLPKFFGHAIDQASKVAGYQRAEIRKLTDNSQLNQKQVRDGIEKITDDTRDAITSSAMMVEGLANITHQAYSAAA